MDNPKTNPISLFFDAISNNYAGLIAVLLISATTYLFVTEKNIPKLLEILDVMIVSYLFGKKSR
ncbi:hypothetical protein RF679_13385 [Undibacterium cyanobacteriorum]|uniref:Uncharacterized protein n=1 Tax=Undibacterium cyanobacteriorum TaxID=3073561 RepID=A0ABY9REI6_9BURK|nr:hypothetical protein [Undibacterium sp. 20NA77.5]WMW79638.1 hypothetical protein RF679_13385 [Undibacterium sp. 20NA77.5]